MDEEFDFGMAEEEDGYRGSDQRNGPESKPTEQQDGKDESKTTNLVEGSDPNEMDHVKAKKTRRQSKPTQIRRNRRVERC